MNTLRTWRVALYGCLAAVMVLALMPVAHVPSTGWDKTDHVAAFAVLALLGTRAYPRQRALCMAALLAYGVLIELLQALTPYRFAEWRDVVADAAGIALALALVSLPPLSRLVGAPSQTGRETNS